MNIQKNEWKLLTSGFNAPIHDSLLQLHHAAQFIALAGHYLVPQKPDDSNTNMKYVPQNHILIGKKLPHEFQIALHLSDFKLIILNKDTNSKEEISISDKTKQDVFVELKQRLSKLGINTLSFNHELHYELPIHPLDKGALFLSREKLNLNENLVYRSNADLILSQIAEKNENAEPVRIWPHHFDTGSLIPISYNKKGELTKSIGIGWSMPDSLANEPYFYLSFWLATPVEGLNNIDPIKAGMWKMPNWDGAILTHSEIIQLRSAKEQYDLVNTFFTTGINLLKMHLKNI